MDVGCVTVPGYRCILAQSVTIHVQSRECLSTVCMWKILMFFLHTIWLGPLLACNFGKENQRTTKGINNIQTICLANHTLTPDSRVIYMHSTVREGGGWGCSGGITKLANHISHQTAFSQARLHLMDIKMSLPLKGGQPRLRFGCVRRKAGKGLQQVITSCKPYARTICLTHNTYTSKKWATMQEKLNYLLKHMKIRHWTEKVFL